MIQDSQCLEVTLDPPTFRGEPICVGFQFPLDADLEAIRLELEKSAKLQNVTLLQGTL
mgnify:CR=1 FL=1